MVLVCWFLWWWFSLVVSDFTIRPLVVILVVGWIVYLIVVEYFGEGGMFG